MSNKKETIKDFSRHVSRGKAEFYSKLGMNFVMGRREGPWLFDIDEKKKLYNLHCNGGVFNLGHKNEEIIKILVSALNELDIGNHHLMSRERAECGKKLASLMPGSLDVCIFGVSGGESVDLALKIARGYTGRKKIISAIGGYHGHTGLAVHAGDAKYRKPFNLDSPDFIQTPFGDLKELDKTLKDDTAAVILEPVPATLGMVMPPEGFLEQVKELCWNRGALFIADEIQTGLGRTGKMWAVEHYNVQPDIMILGKGLSGGIYPITATAIRRELESVFFEDPFIHVSTFGGAEPGCRVASKVLELTSDPSFLENVEHMGLELEKSLRVLIKKHNGIFKGIRRKGLMIGLVFRDELTGRVMTKAAYDAGLLLIYANNDPSVCQMLPPLTIGTEDIGMIISLLDNAMSRARKLIPVVKLKNRLGSLF